MRFQPSRPAHYARQNSSSVGRALLAVGTMGTSELVRASVDALNKDVQYRAALDKATKHRLDYFRCKSRRAEKGKESWPQDTSKSVFSSNCRTDYVKWKEWEQKAADRAKNLSDSLKSKGKLAPEVEVELNNAINRPQKIAGDELKQDILKQQSGGKGKSSVPDPSVYTDTSDSGSMLPLVLVGLVGLAVVGGSAYYLTKE